MAALTQTSSREFNAMLLATPSIVSQARQLADAHLLQWRIPRSLADDVLIVVSELVTNGVKAKIGEDIRLSLYVLAEHVLIEVWDPVPEIPIVRLPIPVGNGEQDDTGGRGLSQVVQGLSDSWGVRPDPDGQGKTVFALVRIAPLGWNEQGTEGAAQEKPRNSCAKRPGQLGQAFTGGPAPHLRVPEQIEEGECRMPLVNPQDRFPSGLPGHSVPVSAEHPTTTGRPWGMDHAVLPVRSMGKHDSPTTTKTVPKATQYTDDSKIRPDTVTETVTD